MVEYDPASSVASDMTEERTLFEVATHKTEGAADQKETFWMDTNWAQNLGYYNEISEVAAVIDAKARWAVGKGFKGVGIDAEVTEILLGTIKGNGFDTFNTILENMIRTMEIGGNAYAEQIRDKEGNLINLKPLDPEVMRHVANPQGIIIRFEQIAKTGKKEGKVINTYTREKIFYLPRNRVADEIHGNTMIARLASIILMRNEAMADIRMVYHRFVTPRWIIKLSTDNKAKIAVEKAKWDLANEKGENMYIPMGSVEVEQMAISPNSTLNPQTWIDNLNTYFYESAAVPKIIVGGSGGFTDAAVKIAYLAWQQTTEEKQLEVEEQCLAQLNVVIELEFPASLEQGLLSEKRKEGTTGFQPNETIAGRGQ